MHSYAQMNGQHQRVGPPSQTFQTAAPLTQDSTRNQVWSSEDAYNYVTLNSGVQPSERGNVTSHNGACSNRGVANWQNSAAPYPRVHSQNVATPDKDHYHKMLLQHLASQKNSQNMNASPSVNGFPAAQLQTFNRNSANQCPQNTINTNSTYPQQDMSSCWKPSAAVNRIQTTNVQAGQAIPHSQPNGAHQGLYQNAHRSLTRGVSAYSSAASSVPHEQVVNSSMLPSAAVHNRKGIKAAHYRISRQNNTEQRFSSSYPVSHQMASSQFSGIDNTTTQSSNTKTLCASNMNQKTQQHTSPTCFAYNDWANTNCSDTNLTNQPVARYVGGTSELPPNPNVAPQQMPRPNETMDSLGMSYTVGSDGCRGHPPPYNMHVNMARQSNWNMQTGTSVPSPKGFNVNVSQSLPLQSGQSLPQSIVSRAQHTVNAQPIQNSLPNVSSVTTVENGSGRGKTNGVYLPNTDIHPGGSPVGLLSNAPQIMKEPGRVSSQRRRNPSFLAKHPELISILGVSTPVLQNDGSAHSTPSHTGTRVVAVVQPLSQENAVTTSATTTCEAESDPEKDCISPDVAKNKEALCMEEQFNIYTQNPNQTSAIKTKSNDGTILKSSDSDLRNSTRTSEPDNEAAAAAQNPTEVTPSQSCPKEQNLSDTPPSPPAPDLSSLPTTSWTAEALTEILMKVEKVPKKSEDVSKLHISLKLAIMFWKPDALKVLRFFQSGKQKYFTSDVERFCESHVKQDTVVLSQVKQDQLKHYHVLKDGEVYSESPYKSSWLNINDQLDEIDKDFGFPWVFKHRQCVLDIDSQTDRVRIENSVPEPIVNKEPNTESESTGLIEEKQPPPIETLSTPLATQNESESDDLNDSPYSFKIHVLAPEEAKVLYEQVQKDMDQIIDYQELKRPLVNNSVQSVTPKEMDAASKESVGLIRSSDQIDQICCLSKLMEMKSGLSKPSFKCQCKEDQSHPENIAKTLIPDPGSPGKSPGSCQIISLSGSELCDALYQIIDLTDSDEEPHSTSDQEPKIISEESNSSQSDVAGSCEDDLSNRDPVFPNDMVNLAIEISESVDKCAQEEFKSAETMQSSPLVITTTQTELSELPSTENDFDFQISHQKEDCGEAQLQATDVAESSLQSEEESQFVAESSLQSEEETEFDGEATNQTSSSCHLENGTQVTKQKRQSSITSYFPSFMESKKCKQAVDLDLQNVSDVQLSASEEKTVELVLFGSAKHKKGALFGSTKNHIFSTAALSHENIPPPPVLSVIVNTFRRNSVEAPSTPKYSVKDLLYEKWRTSFPTTSFSIKKGRRKKWKIQRHFSVPLSTLTLKRMKQSVKTFESCETKVSDGNEKISMRLKRKSLSSWVSPKETKKRRSRVALEQPDVQERSNTENGILEAMLLQENNVLKFSVLPNTFSLMDGSNWRNVTADPITDKPELAEDKDRTINKAVKPKVGQWNPSPQKQYQPLSVPKNVGLFNEYQKKYKDKKLSSPEELPGGRL